MQQKINFNNLNNVNKIINLLSKDFNEQKDFILNLKQLIIFGKMQFIQTYESLNNNLPHLMNELGLPFCDLMNNNIINYYVDMYKALKAPIIKNILISFIKTFNFKSINKTPADTLIEILGNFDNEIKQIADEKRAEKNEIEEIYDTFNTLSLNEKDIMQLKEKINDLEKRNIYSISTIQYLKEKLNSFEEKALKMNINNSIPNINNIYFNNIMNNYQNINNFFFPINMNANNNFGLPTEEINKLKETPLKERTYLYLGENLNDKKNDNIEFENYSYPFDKPIINELKRSYCGFLNGQGGSIYLGINDKGIVEGLKLEYKQRDTIRNELVNYTYDFFPKCRIDKINVSFIKIKNILTKNLIENLFVIKINVIRGEPYILYSLTSKEGFISTLRLNGQLKILTAEEIHKEIMKRGQLKQNYINGQK